MRSSFFAPIFLAPFTLGTFFAFGGSVSSCSSKLLGNHGASKTSPNASANSKQEASPSASAELSKAAASAETAEMPPPAPVVPRIGAIMFQTQVMSDMEWLPSNARRAKGEKDKSVRLGYLRQGATVPVIPEPHKKANCPEGWYELVGGGYVCGKQATTDLNHPKIKDAHLPDRGLILPYQYGANIRQGEPLYHQVPSRAQRARSEPWLMAPRRAAQAATAASASAEALIANPDASNEESQDDSDKPWYLRELDGGAPSITLDELRSTDGPVARRMVKGFILSLDQKFDSGNTHWWRTMSGLVTPADAIYVTNPPTEFHGIWFTDDFSGAFVPEGGVAPSKIVNLPVAFIVGYSAHRWAISDDKKKASIAEGPMRHFMSVGLTDTKAVVGGQEYWETTDGYWLRAMDATKTEPGPPPPGLAPGEKWIDVNLKRQTLVAFEGDKPIFATIVSSGRKDHETPPGSFRIREKHITSTMDGDADVASDGPYSIDDVPYIQYFNAGYALHGAFWHSQFGHVKSHGCINLAPWDARALFAWTGPALPESWHGVFATKEQPGTIVIVREK